jgi:hypothetical protein
MSYPFSDPAIASAFDAFPDAARPGLLSLRTLIHETAATMPQIGGLTEALRWGQPSYMATRPRTSSTIRLGIPKAGGFALYAHCQSTVITAYSEMFGDQDRTEGNRAVLFNTASDIAPERLRYLIRHALCYHRQGAAISAFA